MRSRFSNAVEECLETIYRLEEVEGAAKTSKLASMLGVAKGTVTNAIERLEKMSLITHSPYRGVRLTRKGRSIAVRVIRRHRLSERLLTEVLKVGWEAAHENACLLEHSITDEIADRIEDLLQYPKTCPHGNPIPRNDGSLVEDISHPLTVLGSRYRGLVVKIVDERPKVLKHLKRLNIKPGTCIEVVKSSLPDGSTRIRLQGGEYYLSSELASAVRVQDVER